MSVLIYGRHTSYNVQKVLWLLEELGIAYRHIPLGGRYGGTETEEFLKLNPMGKVPVLVDGDKVIWESNSILRYLVDAHGNDEWKKADPFARSRYERWMDWSQSKLEPAFVGVFWGFYRTPADLRNMGEVEKSLATCGICLEKLDEQLQGQQYLVGEKLTLADITCGVFIYRLVEIELGVTLPVRVSNWYERLQNLHGYRKWVMSDFSELKGRQAY